jgi:hypothetical protein
MSGHCGQSVWRHERRGTRPHRYTAAWIGQNRQLEDRGLRSCGARAGSAGVTRVPTELAARRESSRSRDWRGLCLNKRMHRWLAWSGATIGFTCIVACASPTLPLPPPDAPVISAGLTSDTVRLTADRGALPDAIIVVFNTNPAVERGKRVTGTQAGPDGSWTTVVPARPGECLQITQIVSADTSPPVIVCVRRP